MFNYINFNANKRPVKVHYFLQRFRENSDFITRIPQTLSVVKRDVLGKIRGKLVYRSHVTSTHKVPEGNSELVVAFYVKR
jgi:hypothetical protein